MAFVDTTLNKKYERRAQETDVCKRIRMDGADGLRGALLCQLTLTLLMDLPKAFTES